MLRLKPFLMEAAELQPSLDKGYEWNMMAANELEQLLELLVESGFY